MGIPSKSFLFRHKLISAIRDIDLKGFRRLSIALPRIILPNPENVGEHILTTIHGVKLRINPSLDKGVELSLFQTGTYEKGTINFLENHLKSGDVVFDIGANIGLISSISSKFVGEDGLVYAFEANPKTIPILQENLSLNSCKNVQVYPIALSDSSGETLLFENWNVNRGGASLISQNSDQQGILIQMEKLDDLFDENTRVNIVKIDVEGFEPQVLKGGLNLFSKQLPIFIVEVSTQREFGKGANPQEVIEIIRSFGTYSFYKNAGTKERKSKLLPILTEKDLPEHDNIYCIPQK